MTTYGVLAAFALVFLLYHLINFEDTKQRAKKREEKKIERRNRR